LKQKKEIRTTEIFNKINGHFLKKILVLKLIKKPSVVFIFYAVFKIPQ